MSKNKTLSLSATKSTDNKILIEVKNGERMVVRDACDLRLDVDRKRFAQLVLDQVPALSIETIERELLAIDPESLPVSAGGPGDPWPEPVGIEWPSVPAFPVDALPEPLRAWVIATADATQTPPDLSGMLALAACAGAVARRVEIVAGRGWVEPINLYVACLLDPANRKSAVFSAAMRPLRLIEAELVIEATPEVARAAADRRIKEAELKTLERKAASGCGESRRDAGNLAAELSSEPVAALPKLLVDDATAEAIEMQLASQGGRMVVAGCEGGLFDVMAGRYSSGVGNLDCFLKGHAGDDLRVDRVTRGSIMVPRCCLTLAYAVQPDVVRSMAEKPSFRGRGLIGRFMYSVPVSRLGLRAIDPEPVPVVIAERYEELIRRLAAVPSADEPWEIELSHDASARFHAWQAEVESWLGDGGRLFELRDWGGKLCGLTARLAAILHLVESEREDPWNEPVRLSVIESAIVLARWAVPHAEAVIRLMLGAGAGLDDAAYVLRWIRDRGLKEFSRRDAGQHGRSRFDKEPERLKDALEVLADRGWIRRIADSAPDGAGRPSGPRFIVRPELPGLVSDVARVRGVI